MWIARNRVSFNNILDFLHATLRHKRATPMFDIGSSWTELWRRFIEVAFHFNDLQLTEQNDSWKIIFCGILQLLEGKQFERGGFVTFPFCKN